MPNKVIRCISKAQQVTASDKGFDQIGCRTTSDSEQKPVTHQQLPRDTTLGTNQMTRIIDVIIRC